MIAKLPVRIFSVLALSFLALALSACGGSEDQQSKYLERAIEHFDAENYEKAQIDARNVLQINPKNIDARVILADIAFEDGNLRKAYGGYTAAVAEAPDNIKANVGLTRILIAVKDFDRAIETADTALAKDPTNTDAMGYKALGLINKDQADEAFKLAKEALAIEKGNAAALAVTTQHLTLSDNTDEALRLLEEGQKENPEEARISIMKLGIYNETKDMEGLERELKALTSQFPESEQYSSMLTRYYIRESRPEDAEASVRRFAEENEDSFEARQRLVVYLLQQESQERAIKQAEEYMRADPSDTRMINTLAEIYLFTGDKKKGTETLYESIKVDGESVGAIEARSRLISLAVEDNNLDEASKLIEETLEIERENEVALMSRAAINLSNNELKPAIADLRTVIKNNPDQKDAMRVLSQAQEAVGNRELALDNYKKLIALGDRDQTTLVNAARIAIQLQQYQDAEKYVRMSLEQQDQADNPALITNLVRLLALKEDWGEAQAFADRLVESDSSRALGYYLKGAIDMQTGDQQEALANFKRSLDEQPLAIESLAAYATEYSNSAGRDKGIEFVRAHCEEHEFANCYYVLGTLYAQNDQLDAAKVQLEKSLKLEGQSVRSYRQLARIEAFQKDKQGYEETLERGIEATGNRSLKFDLATYLYSETKYQQAADIYEAIIEGRGEDGGALAAKNNVAMIYADHLSTEENLLRARALIVDLQESESAAYLDTVGWVSYRSGNYEQAVTYTKAAVDKLGSAPILQYHLGMAYYKTGELELAKEHLELAVADENMAFDGIEEARETLKLL